MFFVVFLHVYFSNIRFEDTFHEEICLNCPLHLLHNITKAFLPFLENSWLLKGRGHESQIYCTLGSRIGTFKYKT